MIRLDVAEYCDECDDFTAAVEKPSKMFTEARSFCGQIRLCHVPIGSVVRPSDGI